MATDNKRYITYNLLNEQFFSPLIKNIIDYIPNKITFIPLLKFCIPLHEQSSIYIEGIKHLEKDIDSFHHKFNELKKDCCRL